MNMKISWFLSQCINHEQFIMSESNETNQQFNERQAGNLCEVKNYKEQYVQALKEFISRNNLMERYKKQIKDETGEDFKVKPLIFPLSKPNKYLTYLAIINIFDEQNDILNKLKKKVLSILKNK